MFGLGWMLTFFSPFLKEFCLRPCHRRGICSRSSPDGPGTAGMRAGRCRRFRNARRMPCREKAFFHPGRFRPARMRRAGLMEGRPCPPGAKRKPDGMPSGFSDGSQICYAEASPAFCQTSVRAAFVCAVVGEAAFRYAVNFVSASPYTTLCVASFQPSTTMFWRASAFLLISM